MASYSLRVAMRNQVGVRLPHRSSPAVSFNITRTNLSEVLTIVKGLELTEAELAEHHIRIIEFIERIPEYIAYREEEVTLVTQFLRLTIELGTTVD